jgi:hypothetical protein
MINSENDFSVENFKKLLKERILKTDIKAIKNDVCPFIKNPSEMDIWSTASFWVSRANFWENS